MSFFLLVGKIGAVRSRIGDRLAVLIDCLGQIQGLFRAPPEQRVAPFLQLGQFEQLGWLFFLWLGLNLNRPFGTNGPGFKVFGSSPVENPFLLFRAEHHFYGLIILGPDRGSKLEKFLRNKLPDRFIAIVRCVAA